MANWSSTYMSFSGDMDTLEELKTLIEANGCDFGKYKMPKILRAYATPSTVVSKEEWKEHKDNGLLKVENSLRYMKDSVHDRLLNKYGCDNWYEWAIENWGTKWSCINSEDGASVEIVGDELILIHQSAWSGACNWFKRVCEDYSLNGTYTDEEQSCDFIEYIKYEKGVLVRHNGGEFFSDIGMEINDIYYYLDNYDFIAEEENWEEEYSEVIDRFAKFGYSLEMLKNYWGVDEVA